jgi:hypothetical protein
MSVRKIISALSFVVLLLIAGTSSAQNRQSAAIEGNVIDLGTSNPLEFANIVLFNLPDSSQAAGTVTNNKGIFSLTGINFTSSYSALLNALYFFLNSINPL